MSARTSRADLNYLSCSKGVWQAYAGTDHAEAAAPLPSYGGVVRPMVPSEWDAVLKIADGTSGLNLTGLEVAQGRENSIDCNSLVHDCSFEGDFGVDGGEGQQVITTKGGCYRVRYAGVVHSSGNIADVVCAAWSDQSHALTTDIDYSGLTHVSGRPLTFVLSRCRRVKLPPRALVLWPKSVGYELYWYGKFAAVKLHIIG